MGACGRVDRAVDLGSEVLGFNSHHWSCEEMAAIPSSLHAVSVCHAAWIPGGMKIMFQVLKLPIYVHDT